MAATVIVRYDNGGSDASPGTHTDLTSVGPPMLRFKLADNATIDSNNPPVIPSGADVYSYWKQIHFECTGGTFTTLNNFKFYTSGSNPWTGVDINVAGQFPTNNSGSTAGYEVANSANNMNGEHSGVSSVASVFSYTSGSALSFTCSEAGNVIDASGEMSNLVVLQMKISNTASPGDLSNATITLSYDEI